MRWGGHRHGLTPESGALARWRSNSPLMILGSHDWNTPGDDGDIKAGGKKQAAVLAAAQPSTCVPQAEGLGRSHKSPSHSPAGAFLADTLPSMCQLFVACSPRVGYLNRSVLPHTSLCNVTLRCAQRGRRVSGRRRAAAGAG